MRTSLQSASNFKDSHNDGNLNRPTAFGAQEVVALDLVRCLAAFYVVLHHLAARLELPFPINLLLRFGQEAVIIFFLLSGIVIFASERERALHPKGYYLRRIRRIYPTLLFAMCISTLIAWDNGSLSSQFNLVSLFGTIFGLQDVPGLKPNVILAPYMNNLPLWSLSYEMFFYLIFPIVLRFWHASKTMTNHVVGAVCCLSYISYFVAPNHLSLLASYFLIWWGGAMAAHAYLQMEKNLRPIGPTLFWLAVLLCISMVPLLFENYSSPGVYPILMVRHFGIALFILILLSFTPRQFKFTLSARWNSVISFLASISFGVYVLHYPVLVIWERTASNLNLVFAFGLMLVLAWVSEKWIYQFIPKAPVN